MRVSSWIHLVLAMATFQIYVMVFRLAEAVIPNDDHYHVDEEMANILRNDKYYNDEEMLSVLQKLTDRYPRFTNLYSIGKSAKGKDIWVLQIFDKDDPHNDNKARVKLVDAGILGNGPVGRLIAMHFAYFLLQAMEGNYPRLFEKKVIDALVQIGKFLVVEIAPSLNPDNYNVLFDSLKVKIIDDVPYPSSFGYDATNDMDFNFDLTNTKRIEALAARGMISSTHPEVSAVVNWSRKNIFIASVSLAAGMEELFVAKPRSVNWLFPGTGLTDVAIINSLAQVLETNCTHKSNEEFADKFRRPREVSLEDKKLMAPTMQDFNFRKGTLEFIMGTSTKKWPELHEMKDIIYGTIGPLAEFYQQVCGGIWGQIISTENRPIVNAEIEVLHWQKVPDRLVFNGFFPLSEIKDYASEKYPRSLKKEKMKLMRPVLVSPKGYFWTILLKGVYTLKVSAPGYKSMTEAFLVQDNPVSTVVFQPPIVLEKESSGCAIS